MDFGETDALRLANAEGDDLPGIILEEFAHRRLISTAGPELPSELRRWSESAGQTVYWKPLDPQQRQSPRHLAGPAVEGVFEVRERGTRFGVSFQSGYSQGLFLDQRDNRRRVRARCKPGQKILNTFAYTGAFSVCAALAGAVSTTLDLSRPCLDRARDNFRRNRLDPAAHHFCRGDTFHWLKRFARQGRTFHGIVLDPPTFSRDHRGRVFRVEHDFGRLIEAALASLAPHGWLLCTTNCRRLSHPAFERAIRCALTRRAHLESFPMPPDFPGDPYLKSVWVTT